MLSEIKCFRLNKNMEIIFFLTGPYAVIFWFLSEFIKGNLGLCYVMLVAICVI